ncbi:hypothetical protein [Sporolactobacillus pectinivorans]|uniref:hypothetical protein n=1 Tax=Sporolactobacillus pectinivorans TaxID=1591408 RepID=UPI0012FDE6B6|nr:hypothetical protein [Sporolactobacillus pectinivorans]
MAGVDVPDEEDDGDEAELDEEDDGADDELEEADALSDTTTSSNSATDFVTRPMAPAVRLLSVVVS